MFPTFSLRLAIASLLLLLLMIPVIAIQPVHAASTADLAVSMTAEKKSLKFGDTMALTAKATNIRPETATGVFLSLGTSDSYGNLGGTCPDGTVSSFCDVGTLAPGASVTVQFFVMACCQCCPDFIGVAVASAGHDADTVDLNSANDSIRLETRLKGKPPF